MNAAKLRNRLTIQVPIRTKNAEGDPSIAWAVLRTVYASLSKGFRETSRIVGREFNFAGKTRADMTGVVVMRVQPEYLLPDMRLVEAIYQLNNLRYRVFNIIETAMLNNVHDQMQIAVKENMSDFDGSAALYTVVTNSDGTTVTNDSGDYVGVLS